MITIWKFEIDLTKSDLIGDYVKDIISVPKETEFLYADIQGKSFCVWGMCDPDAEKEDRTIVIVGTGHRLPSEPTKHIGSTQTSGMLGESLIFHFFELL